MSPLHLLPEAIVFAAAVLILLLGSFLPKRRLGLTRAVGMLALVLSIGATATAWLDPPGAVFAATFTIDTLSQAARVIIAGATVLVLALDGERTARQAERVVLLLMSALGAMILAGATDLAVLAVGFLLSSIPLYALVGLQRTPSAAEAALKTYLIGALLGIVVLLGATVLFGVGASTGYSDLTTALPQAPRGAVALGVVALLGGLSFKIGAVPGHFWIPDGAQAASTSVAAFLTTVPKIGAVVAAYRIVALTPEVSPLLVAVLAAVTMTLGNFAAFTQSDPRRLLGWSTVSQAGYLLLPVAVAARSDIALAALVIYLAGYALSNLTAFAVIAAEPERRELADYHGLVLARPWLAAALLVGLLSLVGTPPTAVFAGKLAAFTAAWDGGFAWLVVIAIINSVASLFYYLRWIAPAFQGRRTDNGIAAPGQINTLPTGTAIGAAGAVLALGLTAPLIWGLLTA